MSSVSLAYARTVIEWDFTKGVGGWTPNPRVAALTASAEGLALQCTGPDPWINGPRFDCPTGQTVFVTIRLKATQDDTGEVFYGKRIQAGHSMQFAIQGDGQWHDYRVPLPHELGPGVMLRVDPGGDVGTLWLQSIRVETVPKVTPPPWRKPTDPRLSTAGVTRVASGDLALVQYGDQWGAFSVEVSGKPMAAGYTGELLGVWHEDGVEWLRIADGDTRKYGEAEGGGLSLESGLRDRTGASLTVTRTVRRGPLPNALEVETALVADREVQVLHAPWLTLFPGLGTFGQKKHQGLFAGVEYLSDEPSSSEADVAAPKNVRRLPDPVKLTFPLMAVESEGRYLGLTWRRSELVCPLFDTPDRVYGSDAQVMALLAPGVGDRRLENSLVAHSPFKLSAGKPLSVTATLLGGRGTTVVPAVKQYTKLRGFPDVPPIPGGQSGALELLSHGWLDSKCNTEGVFRHAVWQNKFQSKRPAADTLMYIDWLASQVGGELRQRLAALRELALSKHDPADPFAGHISHARLPAAPFVFGRLPEFVEQQRRQAESALKRFDAEGVRHYQPAPGRPDYGRTHFADHANGLAAPDLASILYAASLTGEVSLRQRALALLDKQTALYANTVPRGAQTWEVPLHTPDILASAYLVRAYVYGYLLSGNDKYLAEARYWAWTGLPFVCLDSPVAEGKTGLYATTAVLGATNWRAPYWIGQPVQWCGLVYGSALHLLSRYDDDAPWGKIAKGITATGLRMTWPTSDADRQGLLPDFFYLKRQMSAGPAINPGTVEAHVAELFGLGKLYDIARAPEHGWLIHAPCAVREIADTATGVRFVVDGWPGKPYFVLVSGLSQKPGSLGVRKQARVQPLAAEAVIDRSADLGCVILQLEGRCEVELGH